YLGKALDRGYSITHRFSETSSTNKFRPPTLGPTLYEAVVYGKPYAAARIYPALGHGTVKDHLQKLGLKFRRDDLSLAMGYGEVTPFALARAATSFAGLGEVLSPYLVKRIVEE